MVLINLPGCEIAGEFNEFLYDVKDSINRYFQQIQERLNNHEQFEGVWRDLDVPFADELKDQIFGRLIVPRVFSALGESLRGEEYEIQLDEFRINILEYEGELAPSITKVDEQTFDVDGYFTLTLPFDVPDDMMTLTIQFTDFYSNTPDWYIQVGQEDNDEGENEEEDTDEQVDMEIVEELLNRPVEEHDAVALYTAGQNAVRVGVGVQPATMVKNVEILQNITQYPVDTFEVTYKSAVEEEEKTVNCFYNTNLTTEQELRNYLDSEDSDVTSGDFGKFFGYPEYSVANFEELREQGVFVATYYRIIYYYQYIEGEINKDMLETVYYLPFTVHPDNFEKAYDYGAEHLNAMKEFSDTYGLDFEIPEIVNSEYISTDLKEIIEDFQYYELPSR